MLRDGLFGKKRENGRYDAATIAAEEIRQAARALRKGDLQGAQRSLELAAKALDNAIAEREELEVS